MTDDELKEMIALDALDLLDEAESRRLAMHLASDASAQSELAALRDAAAMLVHTIDPVTPAAETRRAMLDKIRELKTRERDSHTEPSTGGNSSNVLPLQRAEPRPSADVTPLKTADAWRYGALAAAVLLGVCIVALGVTWRRLEATQSEVARLRNIETELLRTRERADRAEATAALLRSPESRIALLAGTPQAPTAHGRFMLDPRTGDALLVSFGLPPAPAGKAYQLWFIADGVPLPGGVFTTDAAGQAVLREQVPAEGRRAALFAITLEDAGGVAKPEGKQYLAGPAS